MSDGGQMLMHATAIAFGRRAVLLRGESGTGKSDLALRLLTLEASSLVGLGITADGPARLVSDDQVRLQRIGDEIIASAPETIRGLIEVRGVGIVTVPTVTEAAVHLIVELISAEAVPRLPPDAATEDVLGIAIPVVGLHAFHASTPLKIAVALHRARS